MSKNIHKYHAKYNSELAKLDWEESIRYRPGMYIGGVKIKGFSNLIIGSIGDGFDHLKTDFVSIEFKENLRGNLIFRNVKKPVSGKSFCELSSNNITRYFIPVLNAVSSFFEFKVYGNLGDILSHQIYEKGILVKGEIQNREFNGQQVEIDFELDKEIWKDLEDWHIPFILNELEDYAFLNREKTIEINYKTQGISCKSIYKFEKGLWNKIELKKLKGLGSSYFDTWIEAEIEDFFVEIAFAFREYTVDESYLISYVNGFHSHKNGTHVDGILRGFKNGLMKYLLNYGFEITDFSEEDIKKNLLAVVNIRLNHPAYSGSVKNKIMNPEIIEPIANYISNLFFLKLENDKEAAKLIIKNIEFLRKNKQ